MKTLPGDTPARELDHYDLQIKALRDGDLEAFCDAAEIPEQNRPRIRYYAQSIFDDTPDVLDAAWYCTGGFEKSLFSFLPGCSHCLTQAKLNYGTPEGCLSTPIADQLGLMGNPMIPSNGHHITLDMLPEFARLQRGVRK